MKTRENPDLKQDTETEKSLDLNSGLDYPKEILKSYENSENWLNREQEMDQKSDLNSGMEGAAQRLKAYENPGFNRESEALEKLSFNSDMAQSLNTYEKLDSNMDSKAAVERLYFNSKSEAVLKSLRTNEHYNSDSNAAQLNLGTNESSDPQTTKQGSNVIVRVKYTFCVLQ